MKKLTASHSQSFHTGLKKCIKEKPLGCFKPCSIKSELSPFANDRISFRESSLNEAVRLNTPNKTKEVTRLCWKWVLKSFQTALSRL